MSKKKLDGFKFPNHEEEFLCVGCNMVRPRRKLSEDGRVMDIFYRDVENPEVCNSCLSKRRQNKNKAYVGHGNQRSQRRVKCSTESDENRECRVAAYLTHREYELLDMLSWRHKIPRSMILTEVFNRFCKEHLTNDDRQQAAKFSLLKAERKPRHSLFDWPTRANTDPDNQRGEEEVSATV